MNRAQNTAAAGRTCIEIRGKARDYAAQHGVSLATAFKQLGLNEPYAAAVQMATQKPVLGASTSSDAKAAAARVIDIYNRIGVKHHG